MRAYGISACLCCRQARIVLVLVTRACMYTHSDACTNTRTYTHIHTRTNTHTHTRACAHKHTRTHVRSNTHAHTRHTTHSPGPDVHPQNRCADGQHLHLPAERAPSREGYGAGGLHHLLAGNACFAVSCVSMPL